MFGPADDVPGAPPLAVISYGFWESALAAIPRLLEEQYG
jgi:hypothetical protein